MPSAWALRVIMAANESSSPPTASAIATAMSLADLVTIALTASPTAMVDPGRRPSLVGAMLAAWRDTPMRVSSVMSPAFSFSNSM